MELRRKASEIVMKCLKEKKMSQSQLAARMGEDVRAINQQLHRQNDMKVGRFSDVLEHAGYRVEVVENGGIQRVGMEFMDRVIKTGTPQGLFYAQDGENYIGVCNPAGEAVKEIFASYDECVGWLRGEAGSGGAT